MHIWCNVCCAIYLRSKFTEISIFYWIIALSMAMDFLSYGNFTGPKKCSLCQLSYWILSKTYHWKWDCTMIEMHTRNCEIKYIFTAFYINLGVQIRECAIVFPFLWLICSKLKRSHQSPIYPKWGWQAKALFLTFKRTSITQCALTEQYSSRFFHLFLIKRQCIPFEVNYLKIFQANKLQRH